jgi:hypothetical protein
MIFRYNFKNEKGIVIVTGLLFMVLLTIVGTTAYLVSTLDIKISANYKYSEDAFNQAEAGVQYGIGIIENALEAGTFSLPTVTGNAVALPFSSHSGFSFSLSSLEMTETNAYTFRSTGTGSQGATAKIDVTFKMSPAMEFAVFGCEKMQTDNKAIVNSYDHREPLPQPGDSGYVSTGKANVGSNEWVHVHNNFGNSDIDGAVYLPVGETKTPANGPNSPHTINLVPPVDCDPLDVTDPAVYPQKFSTICSSYNILSVSNTTETIDHDPGTYCYSKIEIRETGSNTAKLIIDATDGDIDVYVNGEIDLSNGAEIEVKIYNDHKVNIYHTGSGTGTNVIDFGNDSALVISGTGEPIDFALFSDTSSKIQIHVGNSFEGLIYAPDAYVHVHNAEDDKFFGAIWGGTVHLNNKVNMYYDTALQDEYLSDDVIMTAWKQDLN